MLKHHLVFTELHYLSARLLLALLTDNTTQQLTLMLAQPTADTLQLPDIKRYLQEIATKNGQLLNQQQLAKLAIFQHDSQLGPGEPLSQLGPKVAEWQLQLNQTASWVVAANPSGGLDAAGAGNIINYRYGAAQQGAASQVIDVREMAFANLLSPVGNDLNSIDTALNRYIFAMVDFAAALNGRKVRLFVADTSYLFFSTFAADLNTMLSDKAANNRQYQYKIPLKEFIATVATALNIDVAFIDSTAEELNSQEQLFAKLIANAGLVTTEISLASKDTADEFEQRRNFLTMLHSDIATASAWRDDITEDAMLFAKEKDNVSFFNFADKICTIASEINADKIAICHADAQLQYGDLPASVLNCVSNIARLNITPGSRVAIIANDSPNFAVAVLSLMYAGCIAIIVNPLFKQKTISHALESAAVTHVFADQDFIRQFQANARQFTEQTTIVSELTAIAPLQLSTSMTTSWLPARTSPFDYAIGMFTSGTTGVPKLILHRQQDFVVAAERYAAQVLHINSSDRAFSVSKMSFAFGLHNCFNALFNRATAVISPATLSMDEIVAAIKLYQPTIIYAVPTVYQFLLNHAGIHDDDFRAVRCFVSAGDRMPVELNRKWQAKFNATILDSLGSTEAFSTYLTNIPGTNRQFGDTGKIVPGFTAKIINERGVICAPGDIGTLWLKGPTLPSRYENNIEATRLRFSNGWYCTNDMFVRDNDGYFRFFGRADDVVKVSGQWVSPQDIEAVLIRHPDVTEIAVIAVGDHETTTRTKAFVVTQRTDHDQFTDELKQYAKQHLERWKYPHLFQYVAALPRTVTGKLQRQQLKALWLDVSADINVV